jgi:hypothetical protein
MRRIVLLSLALPFTLLTTKAAAQTCVGMPAFSSGHMQVAAGADFTDGGSSFLGTFGYGTPRNFYGKAGLGTTSYDGLSGSSFDFSVGGGYQVPLHARRTAELCPVANLSIGSGPNDVFGSGVNLSSRTFSFGASVGGLVGHSTQMQIVPNASFQLANTHSTVDDGTTRASASESYGLLTLGTGFVFNARYSLNPSIGIPVGLDGSSASFGLSGAINFGR